MRQSLTNFAGLLVVWFLTATASAQSPPANFTTVINVPADDVPYQVESDTQLNIYGAETFQGWNTSINVGSYDGSSVNAEANLYGGDFRDRVFEVYAGGHLNHLGGTGGFLISNAGGAITLAGGMPASIHAKELNVAGGNFRLNGTPLVLGGASVPTSLAPGEVLSGVLRDGTPFSLTERDFIANGSLNLQLVDLPPIGPSVITASTSSLPPGIRQGQSLIVDAGGHVPAFFGGEFGSAIIVEPGGSIGQDLRIVGAQLSVSGGSVDSLVALGTSQVNLSSGSIGRTVLGVGSNLHISGGAAGTIVARESRVALSGGTAGRYMNAYGGSVIDITGGAVGKDFTARNGSVVNISGGEIGDGFEMGGGSIANVSGGTFGDGFAAGKDSQVNLFGTHFTLGGVDITPLLTPSVPMVISEREVQFTSTLSDGSEFIHSLRAPQSGNINNPPPFYESFHLEATLTVTLVLPGDYNNSGTVDGADFLAWQRGESPSSMNPTDLSVWQASYGADAQRPVNTVSTPEPTTLTMLLLGLLSLQFHCHALRKK